MFMKRASAGMPVFFFAPALCATKTLWIAERVLLTIFSRHGMEARTMVNGQSLHHGDGPLAESKSKDHHAGGPATLCQRIRSSGADEASFRNMKEAS